MTYRLIVKPEAKKDFLEALEWYEKQDTSGLDAELFKEVSSVLDDIIKYPRIFSKALQRCAD